MAAEIEAKSAPLPIPEPDPSDPAQVQAVEQLQRSVSYLLDRIPSWADNSVRERELKAMESYAKELGYSDEHLQNFAPRDYIALRDAWRGAGARRPKAEVPREIEDAVEQSRKSGSVRVPFVAPLIAQPLHPSSQLRFDLQAGRAMLQAYCLLSLASSRFVSAANASRMRSALHSDRAATAMYSSSRGRRSETPPKKVPGTRELGASCRATES